MNKPAAATSSAVTSAGYSMEEARPGSDRHNRGARGAEAWRRALGTRKPGESELLEVAKHNTKSDCWVVSCQA